MCGVIGCPMCDLEVVLDGTRRSVGHHVQHRAVCTCGCVSWWAWIRGASWEMIAMQPNQRITVRRV